MSLIKILYTLGGYAVERKEVLNEKVSFRTRAHRAHGSQTSR